MDGEEAIYYLEYLRHDVHAKSLYDVALVKAIDALKQSSESVKHGRWNINPDGYYPYCSNCKTEPKGREMTDYCPNCGARMRGDEK